MLPINCLLQQENQLSYSASRPGAYGSERLMSVFRLLKPPPVLQNREKHRNPILVQKKNLFCILNHLVSILK